MEMAVPSVVEFTKYAAGLAAYNLYQQWGITNGNETQISQGIGFGDMDQERYDQSKVVMEKGYGHLLGIFSLLMV